MTSPGLDIESVKSEFRSRLYALIAAVAPDQTRLSITDGDGGSLEITRLRFNREVWMIHLLRDGRSVGLYYQVDGVEKWFLHGVAEKALPILRGHMVLDDLATV